MCLSFEWRENIADAPLGFALVMERLAGTDLMKIYGPMPKAIVPSFIRARRNIVSKIMSDAEAKRLFEPQVPILKTTKH